MTATAACNEHEMLKNHLSLSFNAKIGVDTAGPDKIAVGISRAREPHARARVHLWRQASFFVLDWMW